jgi:arsenite-transporting ATPase
VLRLPLPHVEMDKVLMTKKGDEMIIEIGNFKRDITLPAVLANQEAILARFVDKSLEIHFTAPVEETEKSAKRGKLIDESLYEREVAMD